jgi:hypothetical protein
MRENQRPLPPTALIHRIPALILSMGLVVIFTACGMVGLPTESGAILFQDDFSDPNSGWDRYEDSTYVSDYFDGRYTIGVFAADMDAWANPGLDFGDVRMDVEARKDAGPDDNAFGLLCRYQDLQNFYFFLVSSDGYAGIGISKEGRRKLISGDTMLPSEAVVQGEATNNLRAECDEYALRLFVNGELVVEAQAAEWSSGDVGLIAGTYASPGVVVSFDSFSVRNP